MGLVAASPGATWFWAGRLSEPELNPAVADYAWQRRRHIKQLMMTKEELKQEMKENDGDRVRCPADQALSCPTP